MLHSICFSDSAFGTNTYLILCEKDAVIIDPATEETTLLAKIEQAGATLRAVLLTHAHFDHMETADALCAEGQVPLFVHSADIPALCDPNKNASLPLVDVPLLLSASPTPISNGQVLSFGAIQLEALHTPGHSPGSVCYYDRLGGQLFCGDTLFAGTIGRTDLFGGNSAQLFQSLAFLSNLPKETVLFCGHGPKSTLERELQYNPYLKNPTFYSF